jgi:hypothetical protein
MLAKRFPYAIYYKVDNEACTVWRILACRRSPVRLSRALTKQP